MGASNQKGGDETQLKWKDSMESPMSMFKYMQYKIHGCHPSVEFFFHVNTIYLTRGNSYMHIKVCYFIPSILNMTQMETNKMFWSKIVSLEWDRLWGYIYMMYYREKQNSCRTKWFSFTLMQNMNIKCLLPVHLYRY